MAKKQMPKATHEGVLKIGAISLPCAVLEDGSRVISESGMISAFGLYRSGALRTRSQQDESRAQIPLFMAYKNLQPFIHGDRRAVLESPLWYIPKGSGTPNKGMRAESLPLICEVWLDARQDGKLGSTQEKAAKIADIIIRGLANVGIIALVDEATGYQYDRARTALEEILEKFISKELMAWAKRFPDEFYEQLFRLKNWAPSKVAHQRPGIVGKITNDLVYDRLAPNIKDELHKLTPRDEKGRLKHHLHRRLTEDIGHPALRAHLEVVIALMKLSNNWPSFMRKLDKIKPPFNDTMALFPDDNAENDEYHDPGEPPPLKLPAKVKPAQALKALMEVDPDKVK